MDDGKPGPDGRTGFAIMREVLSRSDRMTRTFAVSLLATLILFFWPGLFALRGLALFLSSMLAAATGTVLTLRILRAGMRQSIWRLRNRLLVTYMFIGLVPILLILVLDLLGSFALTSQMAVYVARAELDRRISMLESAAIAAERVPVSDGADGLRHVGEAYESQIPGLQLLVSDGGNRTYPPDVPLALPEKPLEPRSGIVVKEGKHYGYAWRKDGKRLVAALAPLTGENLAGVAPQLGDLYLLDSAHPFEFAGHATHSHVPPPISRFDLEIPWLSYVPVSVWNEGRSTETSLLMVRTRPSAVLRILFNRPADTMEGALPLALLAVSILFFVVELVALYIGVSLTRTVTGAVHSLYEGTQRVMHGDFRTRIEASGRDQLAELARSFNRMTENLQQLLEVAKEKERLQSEMEIAREVQAQLYPSAVPQARDLELTASCQPARTCSGDYYDYQKLRGERIAIALGDVAGKGISAALLMASLQSSLRTQLIAYRPQTRTDNDPDIPLYPAKMVAQLNQRLHADTTPEKYATFCFFVYDEASGLLTYVNAGHLPPILIRKGEATRLEVTGMVVGAFPFAKYEAAELPLEPGDLLVIFTDGITEPENAYGEMFGEDRLTDMLLKYQSCSGLEIITNVMQAVRDWTGSPELQDDMTMLVARRTHMAEAAG